MTYRKQHLIAAGLSAATLTVIVVVSLQDIPLPEKETLRTAAPPEEELDETLGSKFIHYESDTFDYGMKYPSNWILDDSRSELPGDVLSDPTGRAFISIKSENDPTLQTREGFRRITTSIEEAIKYDPTFALESFSRTSWKKHSTFVTKGTRRLGPVDWYVQEYTIFRPEHSETLTVTVTIQEDARALHEGTINDILRSMRICHDDSPKLHT